MDDLIIGEAPPKDVTPTREIKEAYGYWMSDQRRILVLNQEERQTRPPSEAQPRMHDEFKHGLPKMFAEKGIKVQGL